MARFATVAALFVGIGSLFAGLAWAQFGGSRAGVEGRGGPSAHSLKELNPEVAQGYITLEGQAELRIEPTEIRVVLAVTAEGETPGECHRQVAQRLSGLKAAWIELGIDPDNMFEDFIAVLPRYDYEIQSLRGQEVAVEKKVGYLMQTNAHLAVASNAEAMRAIGVAFEQGVSDIIAFDYWSKELDEARERARAEAVQAARRKADVLLGALFEDRPPVINLQEDTRVYFPESLYESFVNTSDAEYRAGYSRRGVPEIRTFRPKNTYYRGLYPDADIQSKDLPMRPQISVVATVRLYFQSPAEPPDNGDDGDDDE